jgi:hypothetical protein
VLISNAGISNKNYPVDPILGVDRQTVRRGAKLWRNKAILQYM